MLECGEFIPTIQTDARHVGKGECFDSWRENVREFYDVEPLTDGIYDTERIAAWLLDGLIVSEVAFSPQMFSHGARHTENANYLSLQIYRKGKSRCIFNKESFEILPGEVHILDFSREYHSTAEASIVDGVVMSHDAVGYDPAHHPAHTKFEVGSVTGQFLMSAFSSLKNLLPGVQKQDASVLAKGFCGIIRSLIAPHTVDDEMAKALRAERDSEIRRYVDRHLSDPRLDASKICDEFNMSRSSLYRCFVELGGVTQYISQRRLERAFYQLLSTQPSRGRVKEVAAQCGYEDAGYFSRTFRRRFGVAPSDLGLKQTSQTGNRGHLLSNRGLQFDPHLGLWLNSI